MKKQPLIRPGKKEEKLAGRGLLFFSFLFYLILWLFEFFVKIFAVFDRFFPSKGSSSFTPKLNKALEILKYDIMVYVLTLMVIYGLFALLNWRFVIHLINYYKKRKNRASPLVQVIIFLAVNGFFLVTIYSLNAAFYPYSDLASQFLAQVPDLNMKLLKAISLALFGVYFMTYIYVIFRAERGMLRAGIVGLWVVLLVAPLDPAFHAGQFLTSFNPAINKGPNVIIIGLDSLNPHSTGYFGYPLRITPHIDSFLRENIVFINCYTPIAKTFPSWYSILTGQYPRTSGARFNLTKRKYIKSADMCLSAILKEQGYHTAHFTDEVRFSNITEEDGFNYLKHPDMGLKDFALGSFHDFSLTNIFFNNPLGYQIFGFLDVNRAVAHIYDNRYFTNRLVSYLDRLKKTERFFLIAHFCVAHWPYTHAVPEEIEQEINEDPYLKLYDTAVRLVDEQLGRTLSALKDKGLYDNSIIIVLSDHGDSLYGHGYDLVDTNSNHVLYSLKPAGSVAQPVHKEIHRLVRTIDIAPTLLDLLGMSGENHKHDGISLLPLLKGSGGVDFAFKPGSDSIIMESELSLELPGGIGAATRDIIEQGINYYEFDESGLITVRDKSYDLLLKMRHRAVLTPDWKLLYEVDVQNGQEVVNISLYDLKNGPGCARDVSETHPDIFLKLMGQLLEHYGEEIILPSSSRIPSGPGQ